MFDGYKDWLAAQEKRFLELTEYTQLIDTELGVIEINYRDEQGNPIDLQSPNAHPTVQIIHGGLGGHDQAMSMFEQLFGHGVNCLSPSRPGYCKTPLQSGESFEQQADLLAALLNTLNLSEVICIGMSSGGGVLYQLALRHPHLVKALIAIDAISMQYLMPAQAGPIAQAIFLSDPGTALLNAMMKQMPKNAVQTVVKQEGLLNPQQVSERTDAIINDPIKLKAVFAMFRAMKHYKALRKLGTDNDMKWAAEMASLPLSNITCPALIIHGTADSDVMFWHSVYAYENIPNAERYWVSLGTHLAFWLHPCEAQTRTLTFIKRVLDES